MTKIVDEPIIGTSKNLRGNVDVHNMQMDFQNSLSAADQYSDWKKYIMAEMVYFLSFLWLGKSEIICYNYTEKINSKGEF